MLNLANAKAIACTALEYFFSRIHVSKYLVEINFKAAWTRVIGAAFLTTLNATVR